MILFEDSKQFESIKIDYAGIICNLNYAHSHSGEPSNTIHRHGHGYRPSYRGGEDCVIVYTGYDQEEGNFWLARSD